jgi:hypothetical protein
MIIKTLKLVYLKFWSYEILKLKGMNSRTPLRISAIYGVYGQPGILLSLYYRKVLWMFYT